MKKLKLGMVGGGQGAFIGAVHRMAARLDGHWELVAGALSSDPTRARTSAAELGLASDRTYTDFQEMARAEAARSDGIDAVAIVTPNHMHAPVALAFLKAGIHVICDKPLAATLAEAETIAKAVEDSGKHLILTHNYTGYPLVRQAREMVARGDLGKIRVVQVEYAQDWLAEPLDNKQADWRTDPKRAGAGGCVGDIGTHALNLAHFVTGLEVKELSADLDKFVEGRQLDDNVQVLLRFKGGAKGMLWASQVAVGEENGLRLRIYGDKGGLAWQQENPNAMTFTRFGQPKQIMTRGGAGATKGGLRTIRVPPGHPEGYIEGFATIYSEAAALIREAGVNPRRSHLNQLPGIMDGRLGMQFIMACIRSSMADARWTSLETCGEVHLPNS
ncbi:Gfo/Idh/MocA family protein [Ruegeria sp. HKCCD8929]|uniref:Gfo/Idh/MocA family protein n=1 Tax=Ruegeria sp. HKCCD8929 TaxID=2683006 RepID=UPI0020C41BCB|nr:Gfo/Idh/MocA family oxidoreductase [Ruegeria sp. HKCCD8929]